MDKILREIGADAYVKGLELYSATDSNILEVQSNITSRFVGPDSYWKPSGSKVTGNSSGCFGTSWWIPFPPTLVNERMTHFDLCLDELSIGFKI